MACFVDDLQPSSLVVHEAKMHYGVYDDSRSKAAREWYWCVFHFVDWRLEKFVGSGVDVWDGNLQQTFRLHAMVFCTINDYPAYGNLSGYSVKGHHTCPICEKNMSFFQLIHGKKTVCPRHQIFLKNYHPYLWLKKAFNGSQENESAPKPLDGKEVYDQVKDIIT